MFSFEKVLDLARKHKGLTSVSGLVIVAGLLLFISHSGESPNSAHQNHASVQDHNRPATLASAHKAVKVESANIPGQNAPQDPDYVDNPYFEQEVKARLAQVADVYADQIRFPTFSMPITDQDALQKYLPNQSFAATLPLDFKDENSPTILLKTDKRQYFTGETIQAIVTINGLADGAWVQVEGRLVESGKTLVQATASRIEGAAPGYRLRFNPNEISRTPASTELRAVASLTIDGQVHEVGTPVTYTEGIATLTHVDVAQVNGEYLEIPVHIETDNPGYHELGANLYSADSEQPLVHLTAQHEVRSSRGIIPLRAHISALKEKGHPGPYKLKDIMLARMPAPPTYTTEYGRSSKESFAIAAHGFDEYDDVPYVDEEAQKRLEFLRQLGSTQ
ncbi:hypothetical protein [Hahella ganghwensis]|uniref:hypothetical protein n=1 Tax=Hahella ganghwensis TaxID=286420 RepID=UPI00037CC79A|nr:hypothetical protein [Hahella ganghwensis]